MYRIVTVLRKPALWLVLFLLLFLAWGYYFRAKVDVPPKFVFATGAATVHDQFAMRPTGTFPSLHAIADDGSQVTIGIHQGDFRFLTSSWSCGTLSTVRT